MLGGDKMLNISNEPHIIITPEATYIDGNEVYPQSISIILGKRNDGDASRKTVTLQELLALAKC